MYTDVNNALATRAPQANNTRQDAAASVSQAKVIPLKPEAEGEQDVTKQEQQFDDFLQSDRARIEVGVRLIPLVSANEQGLADRIAALRKELADKHGIWVPAVRIRDSLQLSPDEYRILINGREVARATMKPASAAVVSVAT